MNGWSTFKDFQNCGLDGPSPCLLATIAVDKGQSRSKKIVHKTNSPLKLNSSKSQKHIAAAKRNQSSMPNLIWFKSLKTMRTPIATPVRISKRSPVRKIPSAFSSSDEKISGIIVIKRMSSKAEAKQQRRCLLRRFSFQCWVQRDFLMRDCGNSAT